jgi:hypothetical protein
MLVFNNNYLLKHKEFFMKKYILLFSLGFVISNAAEKSEGNNTIKPFSSLNLKQDDPIKNHNLRDQFNHKDIDGNTPLHQTILNYANGNFDNNQKYATFIAVLHGYPNPFIENNKHRTPLQEAELMKKEGNLDLDQVIDVLRQWEGTYYTDFSSN